METTKASCHVFNTHTGEQALVFHNAEAEKARLLLQDAKTWQPA